MLSTQKPKVVEPEPVVAASPPPAPEPVVAPPPPVTVHDTILSMDLTEYDLEGPTVHEAVPPPPKCIQRRLELGDRVWRWLSKPHVAKKGMRQYTAYSPTSEDRLAMERGDCPAGVHVSVDNRLCWGEDAFLGILPRRFYEQRQAELAKLNKRTIVDSRRTDALDELAARGGFKAPKIEVSDDDKPRTGLSRRA